MTATSHPRKFYGRKQGHKLNAYQEDLLSSRLPDFQIEAGHATGPIDLAHCFDAQPRAAQAFALEIGFGGGEHMLARAGQNPDIGYLGCEVYRNGVAKLLRGIEMHQLHNIRIYPDDARDILERLPDHSFAAIYLLYPDPWPKARHHKRRFVSPENLDHICRLLRPDGLFYFASDIADYVSWTLAHIRLHGGLQFIAQTADDWRRPYADWPGTRYEAKALAAGRVPSYLSFAPQFV